MSSVRSSELSLLGNDFAQSSLVWRRTRRTMLQADRAIDEWFSTRHDAFHRSRLQRRAHLPLSLAASCVSSADIEVIRNGIALLFTCAERKPSKPGSPGSYLSATQSRRQVQQLVMWRFVEYQSFAYFCLRTTKFFPASMHTSCISPGCERVNGQTRKSPKMATFWFI